MARLLGQAGDFGKTLSRVSGQPAFTGELPVSVLVEEIETPGPGQIRAMVLHAGNICRSLPDSSRIDAAIAGLDFMVCIDVYLNETTRHADLILPPTSPLERDNFPIVFHTLALREGGQFAVAPLTKPAGTLHDWEILAGLQRAVLKHRGWFSGCLGALQSWTLGLTKPSSLLALLLRIGPRRMSLAQLKKCPSGVDFGPLAPCLAKRLQTRGKRIQLAPPALLADLDRVEADLETMAPPLTLIGRRTLRSMNSWLHNSPKLTSGRPRCTLLMHPQDAEARGIESGMVVRISTDSGYVEAPAVLSAQMRRGVVSLPHGWGHGAAGSRLSVAAKHPGANANQVLDLGRVDAVSGVSNLNATPVEVRRI